jgi:hypothetical protein
MMWIKLLQLLLRFKCCLMQQMLLAMGGGGGGAPNPPVFDAASDARGNNSAGNPNTFTLSHTCSGSNRALILGIWHGFDGATPTATYNGVAMTLVGSINDAFSGVEVAQYKLSNPASGTHDIVITFVPNLGAEVSAGAVSFTNAHQTTANLTGTQATGSGTSSDPSVNVSSGVNEIVVDVIFWSSATQTVSAGAGQTQRWNHIVGSNGGAGSTEAGAATVTMSWTPTGALDAWVSADVSVKAP